ncbi:MAG: pyridoxine 5'-phosphate synthase [Pyrinomonadaceae bacterium]|jgi:pyridoxine 5-phosphate synthase|nr:pyridoxine 5'-phosphate synthase [Pyrinomonadaceae bacterium]
MSAKLNVNIDHVATVRQARRTIEPSVVTAATICEQAGADGITVHLRQDRRHIQDSDIKILRDVVTTYLNVEMAASEEMLKIAVEIKPDAVTLVPENPNEITTEGGLDVVKNLSLVRATVKRLREHGIFTSLFVDPVESQIKACSQIGAQQIELCTAEYAELTLGSRAKHGEGSMKATQELRRLRDAAQLASQLGLFVAAGHGLTYKNIHALVDIPEITEFNIGHNIISRSIFVGLDMAVKEMCRAIRRN